MSNLTRRHVVIHFPAKEANAVEETFDGSGGHVKAGKRHRELLARGLRATRRVEEFTRGTWRTLTEVT